jgi:16S rRNA (guanine527-N7)-methyltransferase
LLDRQPWRLIEDALGVAGVSPAPALERLRGYAELLIHWNRSVSNLLSRNDEDRLVGRHFLESLGPLRALSAAGIDHWLDIGSGGGLPAIPLALAGVGRTWTLVESRRMKTLFLKKVKQEMGLGEIHVVCARIESMDPPTGAASIGGITSRATLHLGPTLHEASRFVTTGAQAFLWKGERRAEEMRSDPSWQAGWEEGATIQLQETPTVVVSFIKK